MKFFLISALLLNQVNAGHVLFQPTQNTFSNLKSSQFPGDGTVYVTSANTPFSMTYTSDYSWSFWVNHDVVATYNTVMDKGFGAANKGYHMYFFGTTVFKFYAQGVDSSTIRFSCAVTAAAWHHIVVVWNGTVGHAVANQKIYVDGVSQTLTNETDSLASDFANTATPLYVGQRSDGLSFPGKLDEMGFYTTALSGSDVTALYNSGHPTDPSTLSSWANNVSHFRMGDLTDDNTTVHDVHASNNLTWTGTPTYSSTVP